MNVECKVAEHIVNVACYKLKEAVKRNFEEPEGHLNWFSMSFLSLYGSKCYSKNQNLNPC